MRTSLKASLVAVLAIAAAGIAVKAATGSPVSAPLGVILQADRGQVGTDLTSTGATIYDGDRLETYDAGTLRARLGGPQMYLRSNTSAQVHALPSGFSAELSRGTVVVSSADNETFQVLADGAIIRPRGPKATVAQVTWVSAKELVLTSTRGALEVTMGDEVKTIETGASYRMEVESEPADPAPAPQTPSPTARNHFLLIAIIAAAAGTAIGVWRATVSGSGL